jgi:site-specific DNA-methyltransferase (adenine-specific)
MMSNPWKRRVVIGDCVLYEGDCLEVLAAIGPIGACITDPPYSSGGFSQAAISKAKGQGLRSETLKTERWFAGDAMTANGAAFLLREIGRLVFEGTDASATLTIFTDWRVLAIFSAAVESARWRYQNLIVWDKGNAGLGSGFRAQHELAMHFSKGAPPYFSASYGNVLKAKRVSSTAKEHGCEKPVDLIAQIIQTVSEKGGAISDPFMGSGTTGVACVKEGRKFIGIELDPDYFDIACKRIRDAYAQPDMFVAPPAPKPEQLGMLEGDK